MMKKVVNKVLVLGLALSSLAGYTGPVHAQDAGVSDPVALMQEINEANKEVSTVSGTFNLGLVIETDEEGSGNISADGNYRLDIENVTGDARVNYIIVDETEDGNDESGSLDLVLDRGQVYLDNGTGWETLYSETEAQDFYESFQEGYRSAFNQTANMTDEQLAAYTQLVDITETETEYVVSLKPDADLSAYLETLDLNIDEFIRQEVEKQITGGSEISAEEEENVRDFIDSIDWTLYTETLFESMTSLTAYYDKETLRQTRHNMVLTVDVAQLLQPIFEAIEPGIQVSDLGLGGLRLTVSLDLTMDEYDQPVDVVVPEIEPESVDEVSDQVGSDSQEDTAEESTEESTGDESEEASVVDQAGTSDGSSEEASSEEASSESAQ